MLLEAFIRASSELIKDEQLPMEPSDFQNKFLAQYKSNDG